MGKLVIIKGSNFIDNNVNKININGSQEKLILKDELGYYSDDNNYSKTYKCNLDSINTWVGSNGLRECKAYHIYYENGLQVKQEISGSFTYNIKESNLNIDSNFSDYNDIILSNYGKYTITYNFIPNDNQYQQMNISYNLSLTSNESIINTYLVVYKDDIGQTEPNIESETIESIDNYTSLRKVNVITSNNTYVNGTLSLYVNNVEYPNVEYNRETGEVFAPNFSLNNSGTYIITYKFTPDNINYNSCVASYTIYLSIINNTTDDLATIKYSRIIKEINDASQDDPESTEYYSSVDPWIDNDENNNIESNIPRYNEVEAIDWGDPINNQDLQLRPNDATQKTYNFNKLLNYINVSKNEALGYNPRYLVLEPGEYHFLGSPEYAPSNTPEEDAKIILTTPLKIRKKETDQLGNPLSGEVKIIIHTTSSPATRINNVVYGQNPNRWCFMYIADPVEGSYGRTVIDVKDITFEVYRDSVEYPKNSEIYEAFWCSYTCVFVFSRAMTGYFSGLNKDVDRVWIDSCTFKSIDALHLNLRIALSKNDDNKYTIFDVGYNDVNIHHCIFDDCADTPISLDGGKLRGRCSFHHNTVTRLKGWFVRVEHDNEQPSIDQFRYNQPIYLYNNNISSYKYDNDLEMVQSIGNNSYVTSLITKNHIAVIYNNEFNNFVAIRINDVNETTINGVAYKDRELLACSQQWINNNLTGYDSSPNGRSKLAQLVKIAKEYLYPTESLYDIYTSVAILDYHDNITRNMLACNLSTLNINTAAAYSKSRYEGNTACIRKIYNNTWTWDENECDTILEQVYNTFIPILNDLKDLGTGGVKYITNESQKQNWKKNIIRTSLFDYISDIDTIKFKNNIINIPGTIYGTKMISRPTSGCEREFTDNTIIYKYFDGAFCKLEPMRKSNPVKMLTIESTYLNTFPITPYLLDNNITTITPNIINGVDRSLHNGLSAYDWDLLLSDDVRDKYGEDGEHTPEYNLWMLDGSSVNQNSTYGGKDWEWFRNHCYVDGSAGSATIDQNTYFDLTKTEEYKNYKTDDNGHIIEKYSGISRLGNINGEVCRTKFTWKKETYIDSNNVNRTLQSYIDFIFIENGLMLIKILDRYLKDNVPTQTITYYKLEMVCPKITITNNQFHLIQGASDINGVTPLILLASMCNVNYRGGGSGGYGSTDTTCLRNSYGNVIVTGNSIDKTNDYEGSFFVIDPGYTASLNVRNNVIDKNVIFYKLPINGTTYASWADIAIRNISQNGYSEIWLPKEYGRHPTENDNYPYSNTSLTIILEDINIGNIKKWHTTMQYISDNPLKFFLADYFSRIIDKPENKKVNGVCLDANTKIAKYKMTFSYYQNNYGHKKSAYFEIYSGKYNTIKDKYQYDYLYTNTKLISFDDNIPFNLKLNTSSFENAVGKDNLYRDLNSYGNNNLKGIIGDHAYIAIWKKENEIFDEDTYVTIEWERVE